MLNMIVKSFLTDFVGHLADAKLARIKTGLVKRGYNVKVILQAKPGTTADQFVKDIIGAITDAF
jgi:hypothetical protein